MTPEEAWRSSKLRAWGVGAGVGLIGAVGGSVVGLFASLCCLFQFANTIAPLLAGIVGGLAAAFLGRWIEMGSIGGPASGAFLGLRGSVMASFLTGLLGFLFALLWPTIMAVYTAVMNSSGSAMETALFSLGSLAFSALLSSVFSLGGVVVGTLIGTAAGAVVGALRASR